MTASHTAFSLADPTKSDPRLTAADDHHFAAMAASLEHAIADVTNRLEEVRRAPGGQGQQALDRDQEVHRLSARLRTLRRFSLDLCLGRMVPADGQDPVYIGRLGLTDRSGGRLLVDWRSPAAEPFFAATPAAPLGLVSRRRYRWSGGRVTDYWDESFGATEGLALDDDSAFIASLGSSREPRMRDVLGTIQADQDAIIRAGSRGPLVVDGGPGTGKTVVALHRAAYLLYADPRLSGHRGGILFVGPHRPYLSYVADVLPSLGEEGVRTCTLRDLLPEGETAPDETDPEVARLKATAAMVGAVEPAVRLYEEPPTRGMEVETPYADLWLGADDWAEAFASADPGTPHNEARDEVWDALVAILVDKAAELDVTPDQLRRSLAQNAALVDAFGAAWPRIQPTDLVGDLWSVPAYLRRCAPWLDADDVRRLQRDDPHAWTSADLPILDAARQRLGDPEVSRKRRRQEAEAAAQREEMASVVDHLIATDDSEMMVMSMLRGQDLGAALVDTAPVLDPDVLAGPFAHVVVDEAQELTDAEWQMLLLRCPSRSFTVVGDRAQARAGFAESWRERLARVGFGDGDEVREMSLTVNYRTPEEVMAEAAPVIRAVLPDANVPTSIRRSGLPVHHGSIDELDAVLAAHAAAGEGTSCVIGGPGVAPELTKGLEFDLVVLVDPAGWNPVDRYVAMTRATRRLVVLS